MTTKVNVWELARNVRLSTVVESLYPGSKRVRDSVGRTGAREAWKYSIAQGDPLKVADQSFSFLSREIHGGGAINLYSELCGCTPEIAVEELVRDFLPTVDLTGKISAPRKTSPPAPTGPIIPDRPKKEPKAFPLPPVSLYHMDQARAFLVEKRGLAPELVDSALEARMVYPAVIWKENKNYRKEGAGKKKEKYPHFKFVNLVQPVTSFETGKVIGTSNRSLTGSNKINEGDKQSGAYLLTPFTEETTRIVLTESPIEALSYFQATGPDPATCVIGQSGTAFPEWFIYKAGKQGCTIQTSLNNDIAGRKAAGKTQRFCKEHGLAYENILPAGGEIELHLAPTDRHKKLIGKLVETAEKDRTSITCQELESGSFHIFTENSTVACREIYKAEKREKDEVRDINRQRRFEFRQKDRSADFPNTPGFVAVAAQCDINYTCTDWNDVIRDRPGKRFTGPERICDIPEEFKKTPSLEIHEGEKLPPKARAAPAVEVEM